MTPEYMTLAEALATGLPFKHKLDQNWIMPSPEKVWQVQRPKPKARVWQHLDSGGIAIRLSDWTTSDKWQDITDQLRDLLKGDE